MLGRTPPALRKKGTRWDDSIGRCLQNIHQTTSRIGLMNFGENNSYLFTSSRKRNKNDLPIMPGNPVAPIREFGNCQLDRLCRRTCDRFQYQLSFKSAGG
jgi:hypothetical protein